MIWFFRRLEMNIRFYKSLTNKVEEFKPTKEKEI